MCVDIVRLELAGGQRTAQLRRRRQSRVKALSDARPSTVVFVYIAATFQQVHRRPDADAVQTDQAASDDRRQDEERQESGRLRPR